MNEETNSVEFVVPPEGIPVPEGSRAYKMWELVLKTPGEPPSPTDIEKIIN